MKKVPVVTRFYVAFAALMFVWMCFVIGVMNRGRPKLGIITRTDFLGWSFDSRLLFVMVLFVLLVTAGAALVAYFIEKRFGGVAAVLPAAFIVVAIYYVPYVPQDHVGEFAFDSHDIYPVTHKTLYGPNDETENVLSPLLIMSDRHYDWSKSSVECPSYYLDREGAAFIGKSYDFKERENYSARYTSAQGGDPLDAERVCQQYKDKIVSAHDWKKVDHETLSKWYQQGLLSMDYADSASSVYHAD
ncbi:hypothetical protein [Salinicola aestuarinus]|uniref:hypothetical protein n=1 Tax=Salinicola aestuarinus TaxID=1949082 RepID=UPI000DA26869|nr:hypothetical protein [Salinicola aestuarinus]